MEKRSVSDRGAAVKNKTVLEAFRADHRRKMRSLSNLPNVH
jgi:hypothetical protein